ncbi:hypothetical protein PIB30_030204 [Stylosanthes scabra]|uniref:Uncharacterized protein n=1 Tax=Stylosanthes scabra TaxID=79078 RepID=A0ABU6UA87_9FABA|nr:hypothetical protein [Stylosanthes scabra]
MIHTINEGPTDGGIQNKKEECMKATIQNGPLEENMSEPNSISCPFPPRFGPCNNGTHAHREMLTGREPLNEVQNLQDGSHGSLKANKDNINVLQASEVPETAEAPLEVVKTRRVCEKGGIFLDDGYDDILLRDLIGCNDVGKGLSGGKQRNIRSGGRGRGNRRVMLASAKRII